MGTPPHRYILNARLEQARKLLSLNTLPIAQFVQECGFSSQSRLTACFRAAHEVTPASYRGGDQRGARYLVRRVWRRNGLNPHLQGTFKLSCDSRFEGKLLDVVGLYLSPPEHALVLSYGEKSQIQAFNRTQPDLPMKPGRMPTTISATAPRPSPARPLLRERHALPGREHLAESLSDDGPQLR